MELVLYVGISSLILTGLMALTSAVIESRIKDAAIGEVEQQGAQIARVMTDAIHGAAWVSLPGEGGTAAALSLSTASATASSTVFDLSAGTVRIAEGASELVALTSPRVIVSGLAFWNASTPNASRTVRFQFLVSSATGSLPGAYGYQKLFTGSSTLQYPYSL